MPPINFLDLEFQEKSGKILDFGCTNDTGSILHTQSLDEALDFLRKTGSPFICGHNVIDHDRVCLMKYLSNHILEQFRFIDTLYLSPLLFPKKPYHHLVKDDKLNPEQINNPVNDAINAKDLLNDEIAAFNALNNNLKTIYYSLLHKNIHFKSFFEFIDFDYEIQDIPSLILSEFGNDLCSNAELSNIIDLFPEALAYTLALIKTGNRESISPSWLLYTFPEVEQIMFRLRSQPCIQGCAYCSSSFDARAHLKKYFNFDHFRSFGEEPLQEKAVNAALNNKSILTVFPTGGGKSLTYQLPALMAGETAHALTVIISPLQSLMKDQVDNLEDKNITDAVTINGLLDPIERAKSVERISNGIASILYISPEALRSKTIEKLLLGRKIARFVIDEAHCFSSWGHDFRVDYLFIGEFIKNLQQKKLLNEPIPVSCFTATAKPQVIEDIRYYFKDKLNLDLELFTTTTTRHNLHYKVIKCENENDKYIKLRDLLDSHRCPAIVYVSRTKKASLVAERLINDDYSARAFHGKMDPKDKTENQNSFKDGETEIMVATSAFGMGVDKNNVGMVVHYDISDSLENYVQESGRAGRDEKIDADCYVLYNEDDLNKHFVLLNQTKIDRKQIQDIWKAIKDLTRFQNKMSNSALEIARKAGWNEQVDDLETRVTTSIAALEQAGYIKRSFNSPRIFATSILSKNADEAITKINESARFNEKEKIDATRIIKRLISAKNTTRPMDEDAESRVDYLSDKLGISNKNIIRSISLLKEEGILADTKDLSVYINHNDSQNSSQKRLIIFAKLESQLVSILKEEEQTLNYKEINESIFKENPDTSTSRLKTILNFWSINGWIKKKNHKNSKEHFELILKGSKEKFQSRVERRHALAEFIIEYLFKKPLEGTDENKDLRLIQFSVYEVKQAYEKSFGLFNYKISANDIEEALFYLSRIEAIKIDGGFLVIYNKMNIDRLESNFRKQYKQEDYEALKTHYEQKTQQIHIVGEYAKKMLSDYKGALTFVNDYFQLNYSSFLNRYFPGSRKDEIKKSITPAQFKKLFGELSPRQLEIIKDQDSQYLVVAAGPGSGKTRLLVHKLASILMMEDVKSEQLIMLTFSRAAVNEFKARLMNLIGNAALYIEIRTFHSFCFDLVGRIGSIEKSKEIINSAINQIENKEVEVGRIAKAVMVIDEAQDMDEDEYRLVKILMDRNPEMRVIAVGDDDQNIYEFRGSNSKYFYSFLDLENSKKYELIENYRSKSNLVEFTNQYANCIENRIKETPIVADDNRNGKIRIVNYSSYNLINPLIEDICITEFSGSTCVLTNTNEEALLIAGNLTNRGLNVKLVQTNSGFSLFDLKEVRFVYDCLNSDPTSSVIFEESIKECLSKFSDHFNKSSLYEVCIQAFEDFMRLHPKTKYKTDLKMFLGESNIEDFSHHKQDVILVATMHKAKGKEFDNVILLLNNYNLTSEEKRRQLYVALSRAKNKLTIHCNSGFFDHIKVEDIEYINNDSTFDESNLLFLQLTHSEVNLGYFPYVQKRIIQLNTDDTLKFNEEGCTNKYDEQIVKYSRSFRSKLYSLEEKGYTVVSARVNFIVYWFNDETKQETQIVLPELRMERK